MPRPLAPDLPATVTSGQLARLLGVSERSVAARKCDGRLPLAGDRIDLWTLVRRGVDASAVAQRHHQDKTPAEAASREAFSLAAWAVTCARSAMAAPMPGEDLDQAAARGLCHALTDDDYFAPPPGWQPPERVEAELEIFVAAKAEAA